MRIPSGVTDQVIYFVAVDATDLKTRETGLSGFTVYRARNGDSAVAMTTPTVSEVDSSSMPGVYSLLLDEDMTIGSGNDTEEMVFHITCSGMATVTRVIELYRPKITAGHTLSVESDGDLTKADTVATVTNLTNAPTNGDLTATMKASVNAECDTALSDYDPPTRAELTSDKNEVITQINALNNISASDVWALASALSGLDFSDLVERIYEMTSNKMTVNESTGAVALRNIGDSADIATGSVLSSSGTTTRSELSWA